MRLFFICFLSLYLFVGPIHAAQSSVTEAEGSACMGDDKSRKQTEQAAMNDAKRKAVEFVSTQIRSETQIKNFELEKDGLHPLVWTDQVRAARQGFDVFDFLSNSVSNSSGGM